MTLVVTTVRESLEGRWMLPRDWNAIGARFRSESDRPVPELDVLHEDGATFHRTRVVLAYRGDDLRPLGRVRMLASLNGTSASLVEVLP